MTQLSVIIPLAPNEIAWKQLLNDLASLPNDTEVLLVSSKDSKTTHYPIALPKKSIRYLIAQPGRAAQMNAGAQAAQGKFLWFLHADSSLSTHAIQALQLALSKYPNHLLYFKLGFLKDGPFLMRLNAWGATFRSKWLKAPFGDQGLCIQNHLFHQLQSFSESASYGEDHLLVRKARRNHLPFHQINATLYTSSRKYKKHGWLKTTLMHQYLWIKQIWSDRNNSTNQTIEKKSAMAIFAKTKGLSPIKTRLAKQIGESMAHAFYQLSTEAVTDLAKYTQKHGQLTPHWAIAEQQALDYPQWQLFKTLWTGEGDLGMRLHTIYSQLLQQYDDVVLIGTDSPQLDPNLILESIEKLKTQEYDCIIGPALDGGFYLLASNKPIPKWVWTNTSYSSHQTLEELKKNLTTCGMSIYLLSSQYDVDTLADLHTLSAVLSQKPNLLSAQKKLQQWLENQKPFLNSNPM